MRANPKGTHSGKYFFILFACCIIGVNGYTQSFFRTYPIPTGTLRIGSEGYLLISADSNRIAVVGEWDENLPDLWNNTLSILTDSLGNIVYSHGDFLPTGAPYYWLYGLGGVYDLIETPNGFDFVENGCAVYHGGDGGSVAGVIFMDNRMHVEKIDTIESYNRLEIRAPNLYNFSKHVYFTCTPWAYADTFVGPREIVPMFTPIWKLDTLGNHFWSDSLYPEIYKSELFYSIPTADSQIAVLGLAPLSPDTLCLKFYDNEGNLRINYRCSSIINTFSVFYSLSSWVGELLKLKNNILIIGNDSDLTTHRLQLCIETVDSSGANRVNTKKYIINNDIENAIPCSVYAASDSTGLVNYGVTGSNLNYYLSADYRGDSLGSFTLPGCSNSCYDEGNILCETDTANTFIVREYAPGGSLVYQYIYSHGPGHCKKITPLPQGKGKFIMTGEVNDTLFIIRQDTDYIHSNNISVTNIKCSGENTGAINLSIAGGVSPYTYSWSPSAGTSSSLTGLSAGSYTITIIDNNGNSNNIIVSITQPPLLNSVITTTNSNCTNSTGMIKDSAFGGVPPYLYSWSNGRTNDTMLNLAGGSYICTIKDSNGCTKIDSVYLEKGPTANLSITNVSCNGASTGVASISVAGNYSFAWSPVGGSDSVATGLSAGVYRVTITNLDTVGCNQFYTITITQPITPVTATFTVASTPCNPSQTINATATGGGTPPYTYTWSYFGGTGTTVSINVSCLAGTTTDTLFVTDNKGCITSETVHLMSPLTWTGTGQTNVGCYNGNNGTIGMQVCGGNPPYTYYWNLGSYVSYNSFYTVSNLSAGSFTVTVSDTNGCNIGYVDINITQPPALSIITDSTNDNGTCNGSAWVQVSGGTPSYSYLWAEGLTTDTISNQCNGDYCCTVTDANGCIDTACVTINIATGTGQLTIDNGQLTIYPNPNDGAFSILFGHSELVSESQNIIEIYNSIGKKIYSETLKRIQGDDTIDITEEPDGLYLYRVTTDNGSLLGQGKFVIQH